MSSQFRSAFERSKEVEREMNEPSARDAEDEEMDVDEEEQRKVSYHAHSQSSGFAFSIDAQSTYTSIHSSYPFLRAKPRHTSLTLLSFARVRNVLSQSHPPLPTTPTLVWEEEREGMFLNEERLACVVKREVGT